MQKDSARLVIAILVTVIWSSAVIYSMIASFADRPFTIPFEVHAIMGTVAGYFFGTGIFQIVKKNNENGGK